MYRQSRTTVKPFQINRNVQPVQTSMYDEMVKQGFLGQVYFTSTFFAILNVTLASTFLAFQLYRLTLNVISFVTKVTPVDDKMMMIIFNIFEIWSAFVALECLLFHPVTFSRKFDSIWTRLTYTSSPEANLEMRKRRRAIRIAMTLMRLSDMTNTLVILYLDLTAGLQTISVYYFIQKALGIYATVMNSVLAEAFLLSAIFIQIGHLQVSREINLIRRYLHLPDSHLYKCRADHTRMIQLGEICDSVFSRHATCAITILVPACVALCFNILFAHLEGSLLYIHFIWVLISLGFCIIVFYGIIVFYKSPILPGDPAYFSSLVKRSDSFKAEVAYFLERINRHPSGIRYMGLFLMTPDIIPNMATIVFTFLMAVPNFVTRQ